MLARFDEAARIAREAGEHWRELTGDDWVDVYLARIAATAGRHEDAAAHLRRFCDLLEARGLRSFLSTYASSATSRMPPRRRSGGRCRHSLTRAAANTPRPNSSPGRPSRSPNAPTH
jgi:hypothetical protein